MHQLKYYCLVTIVVSVLVGCATGRPSYQQPAGDSSSLATLRMSEKFLGIILIDGAVSMSMSQLVFSGYPGTYIVTPGKRRVRAIWFKAENRMDLWVLAEPGKEYLLRGKFENGTRFRLWFEDTSNGKVVGGLVGSEDEPK